MESNIRFYLYILFILIILTITFYSYNEQRYAVNIKPPDIPNNYTLELYNYTPSDLDKIKKFIDSLKKTSNTQPKVANYDEILF